MVQPGQAQVRLLGTDRNQAAGDHSVAMSFAIKDESDTYNVGWNFNLKYSKNGYASEAAKALFNYRFNNEACSKIVEFIIEIFADQALERKGKTRSLFLQSIPLILPLKRFTAFYNI